MKTIEELIQAVEAYKKGSQESINVIYEKSYRYLYTCVMHIVKNENTAMDILKETYIEVIKNIDQLRNVEKFLDWAAIIAIRKCVADLKKRKYITLIDLEGTEEENYFENIPDNEAFIPETVLQDKEKQRLIEKIIGELSEIQSLCIVGFYYNEQKQEEISEELGISVNTVK